MTDTAKTRALQVAMRSYPGMTINGEGVVALGEAIAQAIRDAEDAVHASYRDDAPITSADVQAALKALED